MRPSRRLIALAGVLALAACGKGGGGAAADANDNSLRSLGKADAPVKVVEYASLACHFCADFNEQEFPTFKAKYIDTGKVHYELKEMLNVRSDLSAAGFMLAACAGKERYFETVDLLFKALPQMLQSPDLTPGLNEVGRQVGLGAAEVERCLTNEEALLALNARVEANNPMAPEGTPTFYVGGQRYNGPNTAESLGQAVDALLPR